MNNTPVSSDAYIAQLREARSSPAVLKYQLMNLREKVPEAIIFVFEGDDDKIVYHNWVLRIREDIYYEPFVCRGKRYVLELYNVVKRDKGNLREGIYYFVDRDFDDHGTELDGGEIFTTHCYSTENYLVTREVLKKILTNEFHCEKNLEIRDNILNLFDNMYAKFLEETRELNWHIFVARRLHIDIPALPKKVTGFISISLDTIEWMGKRPGEMLPYSHSPADEDVEKLRSEFDAMVPEQRYRGKFALGFFEKWLHLLADDHAAETSKLFGELPGNSKARRQEITLGGMATKSQLPDGLQPFVDSMARSN